MNSESDFIKKIATVTDCRVASMLDVGEDHGIHMGDLARILDTTEREVRKMIQNEREAGALICASDKGYYIPASREELSAYRHIVKERGKSAIRILRVFDKALDILDSYREVQCQSHDSYLPRDGDHDSGNLLPDLEDIEGE